MGQGVVVHPTARVSAASSDSRRIMLNYKTNGRTSAPTRGADEL